MFTCKWICYTCYELGILISLIFEIMCCVIIIRKLVYYNAKYFEIWYFVTIMIVRWICFVNIYYFRTDNTERIANVYTPCGKKKPKRRNGFFCLFHIKDGCRLGSSEPSSRAAATYPPFCYLRYSRSKLFAAVFRAFRGGTGEKWPPEKIRPLTRAA